MRVCSPALVLAVWFPPDGLELAVCLRHTFSRANRSSATVFARPNVREAFRVVFAVLICAAWLSRLLRAWRSRGSYSLLLAWFEAGNGGFGSEATTDSGSLRGGLGVRPTATTMWPSNRRCSPALVQLEPRVRLCWMEWDYADFGRPFDNVATPAG